MCKSIVAALVLTLSAVTSYAKPVAYLDINQGRTVIILHDEQKTCKAGFLYATVKFAGRHLNACWRVLSAPGGVGVHIVDEEGDEGLIPAEEFKKLENS